MSADINYTIKSAMHPFPHTIGTRQTLDIALGIMREHNIRHLPVQESGVLKGVLSERDIDFALRVDKKEPQDILVDSCYSSEPYVVAETTPLAEVATHMAQEHIGCALVTENGSVIGIFTTVDACRVLAEVLSGRFEQ